VEPILLWQGFRHEWLREVLGFRLPHRISRLHSSLEDDGFRFAQSTGVDGNYMRPLGRWAAIHDSGLFSARSEVALEWVDEIERGRVPQAVSRRRAEVRFEVPPEVDHAEVCLRGLKLDSVCRGAHQPKGQPCNSNGFWPFEIGVWLGNCVVREGVARAELEVVIARGWTPTRGGVPFLEEKPLNARLDFEMSVGVTLVGGAHEMFACERTRRTTRASARSSARVLRTPVERSLPVAAAGVTGFGFRFEGSGSTPWHAHLGRYLTTLDFGARLQGTDVEHRTGVWIPATVVGTDVRYELESTVLQAARGRVTRGEVRGSLCIHSSDQAPFFSRWRSLRHGPVQSEDVVPVEP